MIRPNHIVATCLFCLCCLFASMGRAEAAGNISISIGINTVTFLCDSPVADPLVAALENPIPLSVSYSGIGTWAMTMIATSDLTGTAGTIPISNVQYVGGGITNVSGSMSKTVPVTIGVGVFTGHAASGTMSFYLTNNWVYAVGSYTGSILITAVSI